MATLLLFLALSFSYMPQLSSEQLLAFMMKPTPQDFKQMLSAQYPILRPEVINKVLTTLNCAAKLHVDHSYILTVIDYSLPSNQKRLWVFDLKEKKLLFHTYVSHGIKSGALHTQYFSNRYNSKASSIGVYQTQKAYYGRDGLSLRLDGLDRSFNDNASNRAVVMHSGWYVEEDFIKKYGRPGRSWGCPALPLKNSNNIINTIKDKSLMVIYYPSDPWFSHSKFLNCEMVSQSLTAIPKDTAAPDEEREAILFAGDNKSHDMKPVVAVEASRYQALFHKTVPLSRMLRRQIQKEEYVALSVAELNELANNFLPESVHFVMPVIKEVRSGYYETQMHLLNYGKIIAIKGANDTFTVYFDKRAPLVLNASRQFIRWVGL